MAMMFMVDGNLVMDMIKLGNYPASYTRPTPQTITNGKI